MMPAGRTCISTSSDEAAVRGSAGLPGHRSSDARALGAGHRRRALPHHRPVRRLRDQRHAGAGPAQARREAAAAVRRLGCALQLHRLEGRRAVFPDHQRRAARPRDRGQCARSGARELAHRRAAGRHRDQQCQLHRRPRGGRIHARRAQRGAAVRVERRAGGRGETTRTRHRHRLPGQRRQPGGVLLVLGLSIADPHPASRRRDEHGERIPHAEGARGFLAVRHRAGVLHQQGRHARAHVHHAPQGRAARRQSPGDAVRLRRLQRHAVAVVQSVHPVVARDGRHLRGRQPARRRRIRRGVAPGRHEAARSRMCSTTSSPPPST